MYIISIIERSKTNKNMAKKSLQFVEELSIHCTLLRFLHVFLFFLLPPVFSSHRSLGRRRFRRFHCDSRWKSC